MPAEIVIATCLIGKGENVIIQTNGIRIIPNTLFTKNTTNE